MAGFNCILILDGPLAPKIEFIPPAQYNIAGKY